MFTALEAVVVVVVVVGCSSHRHAILHMASCLCFKSVLLHQKQREHFDCSLCSALHNTICFHATKCQTIEEFRHVPYDRLLLPVFAYGCNRT